MAFYSINDINSCTEAHRRYSDEWTRQLTESGLPVPQMDLFPAHEASENGRYYSPREDKRFPNGRAVGDSFTEAGRRLLGRTTDRDVFVFQIMVALHELYHHVFRARDLFPQLFNEQSKHPDHTTKFEGWRILSYVKMPENLEERFCDGASLLHLLSNSDDNLEEVSRSWMNRRITNVAVRHNTARTMQAILDLHHNSPEHGLNLQECSKRARNVIAAQDVELDQIITAYACSEIAWRYGASPDPETDKQAKQMYCNLHIENLGHLEQAAVLEEIAYRHKPFDNGPLPQRTNNGIEFVSRPTPIFG